MNPQNNIEKLITELVLSGTKAADERILNDALAVYEKTETKKTAETKPNIWRIIMKTKITKFAMAAVVIIAVVIGINQFGGSIDGTTSAYAIEQTIQASHSVQYLHVKAFMVSISDEPIENWVEFDTSGQVMNIRLNKPAWMTPTDGETVIIWKNNKATF